LGGQAAHLLPLVTLWLLVVLAQNQAMVKQMVVVVLVALELEHHLLIRLFHTQ